MITAACDKAAVPTNAAQVSTARRVFFLFIFVFLLDFELCSEKWISVGTDLDKKFRGQWITG
jgi:hypothetical protein